MDSNIRESSNMQRRLEGFIVCLVLSLADPCWLLALLPELKVLYETRWLIHAGCWHSCLN